VLSIVLGLALFVGIHLVKSLAPDLRTALVDRLGYNPYRGLVSLLLLGAVALIVLGWRNTVPVQVYLPPPALHLPALALLPLAFLLMVASTRPSRLKRWLRHPQLGGFALWGAAHLMLNGDGRSLLVFGTLLLWALLEMWAINRREGVWIRGEAPGWGTEAVTVAITAVLVAAIVHLHPWIAGMPVT